MKKKSWLVGLVLLIGLLLGACGSEKNDSRKENKQQTEIKYFSFSATPEYEEQLNQMVSTFENEHPDIKVAVELAPYEDYFTRLQTLIAGGKAPDVFELNYENFVSYAAKGSLLALDNYVKEDPNFDETSLNEQAFKAFNYEGKQYGMVESFSNVVTFYNKDLFDQAGVAYPTSKWKWQDEVVAAKQITNRKNKVWGTYAPVTMNEFYKVAAQNGGALFDADGKTTINSPENIAALTYMADNVLKNKVSPSPAEMSGQKSEDLFLNGQLGMVHTGIWMFGLFKEAPFKWDIAVEAGNVEKATHFFANGISVGKDTSYPEAAYKFTQFMSSNKAVAKIRIDHSWELPAITEQEILAPYLKQTPPENRQAVFDSLAYLVLPPVSKKWSKLSDAADQEFQNVLLGDTTPEKALATLQKEFE